MYFNKEKIKLGAVIQREQQRQKAEGMLQQDIELELMLEEIEDKAQMEEAKQKQAERYERRTREKEEKEEEVGDVLEDLVAPGGDVISAGTSEITETSNPVRPKNPRGKKKTEETVVEVLEEEGEEEKLEEVTRKRKVGGCINPQEAAEFQRCVNGKMEELVKQMHNDKNLVQPVRDLIRSLKVEYDKLGLFENNGVANVEEIVSTIHNTKGIVWQKSLEGKEILDAEDYNMIIELTMESRLFQEGNLHDKIDDQILGPETEETKAEIMEKCTSLFSNVAKAHKLISWWQLISKIYQC